VKVRLLGVGKPRDSRLIALHDDYADRIRRLGVDYDAPWVAEVRPGGRYSDGHVMEREARALRERLDGRGTVVALDPAGRALTSERLSDRLERWATPRLTLVIGGPLGLDPGFAREADFRWSLSPLTFPHEWVRALAAEQLYRALTLVRGIPYHK
jgi:23S rRNA (pseudouridine1915-N3)-methyltransferase